MPTATEETQNAIEVERRVRKRHLGPNETNLRPARVRRCAGCTRSRVCPRTRTSSWPPRSARIPARHGPGRVERHGRGGDGRARDVTLVDGGNGQTCKLNRFSDAWGLPHVLRATDREGLTDVKTLLQRFPPALYPTVKRQVDDRNPECSYQCLLSLQEGCPHRQVPGRRRGIGLRVDVVVDGPTIAEGLQTFVEYIDATAEGVAKHSEAHAVRGVLLYAGLRQLGLGRQSARRRSGGAWTRCAPSSAASTSR